MTGLCMSLCSNIKSCIGPVTIHLYMYVYVVGGGGGSCGEGLPQS